MNADTRAARRAGARYLVALCIVALGAACSPTPPPATLALSARALPRVPSSDALGRPLLSASAAGAAEAAEPFVIEHDPEALQVYRSTPMHLWVDLPEDHPDALCRWSFGGGATPNDAPAACEIDHTFIGGTADERVTVTAIDGAWSATATRIIPLERLPVSTRPVEPTDLAGPAGIPAKPTGASAFRLVVLADTAAADAARLAAVARRIVAIDADLVVHLGGHADDGQGWTRLREGLVEGLRAARIPLLSAISPSDAAIGPEVRRPAARDGEPFELADGAAFPERWAMSYEGVYLLFLSGGEQSPEALAWARERLSEAQVYESRLVFSYLPLHPFGQRAPDGPEPHTLSPKFKVYELLLRARVTALFSAGHEVYYKGRYGALPVVSVGSASASGQRLLGSDLAQPASIVVVDIERGVPERVFALADPEGAGAADPLSTILDEAFLPETVEVYTQ